MVWLVMVRVAGVMRRVGGGRRRSLRPAASAAEIPYGEASVTPQDDIAGSFCTIQGARSDLGSAERYAMLDDRSRDREAQAGYDRSRDREVQAGWYRASSPSAITSPTGSVASEHRVLYETYDTQNTRLQVVLYVS
ncbi:hypothetical protein E3N88_12967 [Mikania micrantha]|uniref:Uncharacterized protein n=1 Tax=Mikania micrantha TaxID=192012 RepID=A0A5N6P8A1_9ASTR|nr:hypothetical protein E3N88_12967 [Mikania micrantha]